MQGLGYNFGLSKLFSDSKVSCTENKPGLFALMPEDRVALFAAGGRLEETNFLPIAFLHLQW
jgi:hypothetical protein